MTSVRLNKPSRTPILDLVRISAASLVFFHHLWGGSQTLLQLKNPYKPVYGNPNIPKFLNHLFGVGFLGVEIFFVVSGAIIARSAINKTPAQFVIARFVRLSPTYIFAIIVTSVIGLKEFIYPQYNSIYLTIQSLTFTNYAYENPNIDPPTWTLWYELRFYGLVLLLLLALRKLKLSGRQVFITASLVWLFLISLPQIRTSAIGFLLVQDYAPFFILGCLIGLLRGTRELMLFSPAIVISGMFCIHQAIGRINDSAQSLKWGLGLLAFGVFLILLDQFVKPIKGRAGKLIATLGRASYPLYLLHHVLGLGLVSIFVRHSISPVIAIDMTYIIILLMSIFVVFQVEDRFAGRIATFMNQTWMRASLEK